MEFPKELSVLYDEFFPIISKDRNILTAKENHAETPYLIKAQLAQNEIDATIHEFVFHGISGRNVWIPPPQQEKPFILILAHHDTVPNCPGVDDNGSGMMVAFLLVIWYHHNRLDLLDHYDLNIAFVFPDFEEGDPRNFLLFEKFSENHDEDLSWADLVREEIWLEFRTFLDENIKDRSSFVGTRQFVRFLQHQDMLDLLSIVINFETVGYVSEKQQQIPNVPISLNKGDFLSIAINPEAKQWIETIETLEHDLHVISLPIPNRGHPIPDSRRSDHAVFWDMGINAMFCTDTANFRNPHYHKPTDTDIDQEFILSVVDYFVSLLSQ